MKLLTLSNKKIKDIRGEKFGRLTVVEFDHFTPISRNVKWLCKCDCGNKTIVSSAHLRTGSTQSCGCLAKELSAKRIKQIHNKGNHLYFIRCNEFVKIGRANNINQRLNQIKANNPYKITLIREMMNQGHREKEFHKIFQGRLVTGEWFQIHDYEIIDLV